LSKQICHPQKAKSLAMQTCVVIFQLDFPSAWFFTKKHVKIRLLVSTMVKYVFCYSCLKCLSTNLPPIQIQVIGYTNIPSDLWSDFRLSISLALHKKTCQIRLLVITMVKYVFWFCCLNCWSTKSVPNTNPSHWLYKHF